MKKRSILVVGLVALTAAAFAADPARLNERQFTVPNAPLVISLWDQQQNDTLVSYWSAAPDGVSFCEPRVANYTVPFRYAAFDPAQGTPDVPAMLAAGPDTHVYIVQYFTQPFEQYREPLRALGATVHFPLPGQADLVTVPEGLLAQVQALPFVRATSPFQPAYRIALDLLAGLQMDGAAARYSIECIERGPAAQQAVADLITALGGTVHYTTPEGFRMEVTCDPAAVVAAARHDAVNSIEPWYGHGGHDMNNARSPAGHDADYISTLLNLHGEGVRGEVFDTEHARPTHQEFQNPQAIYHGANGNAGTHGTYVYSECFARGVVAQAKGMCPNREQGVFAFYANVAPFGGYSRYLHTSECVDPNGPYRVVFQTSSVGSPQITTYSSISAETDDYLFLYDLLSCQSQSNTGSQLSRPQAWAKNIVSVGGFRHNDNASRADDQWGGASIGPASDGRIKPDFAAYYDSIYVASPSSDTSYYPSMSGTSGATPMTCGSFGMLFQLWHQGVWAGHGGGANVFASRCHMATAKALMANSGYMYKCNPADPGQPGTPAYTNITRYVQGWGQTNLRTLRDQAALSFVIDETDLLVPLQTRTYNVNVAAAQPAFKATLVYTDPKGNPNVQTQHRVNNLDLKVTAPGGTVYWGNNGMVTSSWTAPGGAANTKDTVENVFVQNPAAGLWKVEVIGSEIVQDSHPETPGVLDADFALVVYGGTQGLKGDLNCDGVVDFDDINPFVLALSDPAGYAVAYPNCNIMNGDINGDGVVNFDDINPFVALLAGP
ncbi:MAG: S8 family serine peptidase [Planctomycetota bacterium]